MEMLKDTTIETLKEKFPDPYYLRQLGNCYLEKEDFGQAVKQFRLAASFDPRLKTAMVLDFEKILEKKPEDVSARLCLADFYFHLGELDEAIFELEEILEINPFYISVYDVLGQVYLRMGRTDDTISLLERATKVGARNTILTEMLAGAYLEKGRIKDAIYLYEEMLRLDHGSRKILRILGDLYSRLGYYDTAGARYKEMVEHDQEAIVEVCHHFEELAKHSPQSIYVRRTLADLYAKNIKPDKAVEYYRGVLKLDTVLVEEIIGKYKELLRSYPDHPGAVLALAEAQTEKGNLSGAVETYRKLLKISPELIDQALAGYEKVIKIYPQQVLAHQYLAEVYLLKEKIPEALREFETILGLNSEEADGVIERLREIERVDLDGGRMAQVLGYAYLIKEDARKAVSVIEEAKEKGKISPRANFVLGQAYAKLELWDEAVSAFGEAQVQEPNNFAVYEAQRKAKKHQLELEVETLRERIEQDPKKFSLFLDLARVYWQKMDFVEAIKLLQIAAKDLHRAPLAYNLIGICFKEEGRFDLAETQFQKALEGIKGTLEDLSKLVRVNLGNIYEAQGMVEKAVTMYESVFQEDIEYDNLDARIRYLNASNPRGVDSKTLLGVIPNFASQDIVALWGRDGRRVTSRDKSELSISFGQSHNNTGFVMYLKGQLRSAEEEFSLATMLDTRFAVALNNLGIVYLKEGKLDLAEAKIKEALINDPHLGAAINNLGLVYYLKGDLKLAEEKLRQALKIDKELFLTHLNLGDVLYAQGNLEEAIECFEKAKTFNPLIEFVMRRLMFRT